VKYSIKKFIFGLGSGRCGTMSLAHLLNHQQKSFFTHEQRPILPWVKSMDQFKIYTHEILERREDFVGDVSFYLLPYIRDLIKIHESVKFIIIKRDKEETVNSYIAKAQNRNHWIEHDGMLWKKDPLWDSPYPKYKIPTLKDAISKYYDEYYELCCAIDKNLCWWVDTKDLNSELHCLEMLDFCGFKDPQFVKMKKNAGGSI